MRALYWRLSPICLAQISSICTISYSARNCVRKPIVSNVNPSLPWFDLESQSANLYRSLSTFQISSSCTILYNSLNLPGIYLAEIYPDLGQAFNVEPLRIPTSVSYSTTTLREKPIQNLVQSYTHILQFRTNLTARTTTSDNQLLQKSSTASRENVTKTSRDFETTSYKPCFRPPASYNPSSAHSNVQVHISFTHVHLESRECTTACLLGQSESPKITIDTQNWVLSCDWFWVQNSSSGSNISALLCEFRLAAELHVQNIIKHFYVC